MPRSKWKEQAEYWKTMPASANVLVLAAIFCMFASFGLMNSVLELKTTVASAVASAALMACFASAIAFTAFRAMVKSMIAVIVLLLALSLLFGRFSSCSVHGSSNSIGDSLADPVWQFCSLAIPQPLPKTRARRDNICLTGTYLVPLEPRTLLTNS